MEERDKQELIELRSEDVQEILGTPPGWLVRWGTMVVMLSITMIIAVAWLIEYPDVVADNIVLTTSVPPVEVVARVDGHIDTLLVRENTPVRRGDVLAVVQSTGKYDHIQRLDNELSDWQSFTDEEFVLLDPPMNLELGELQMVYSTFIETLESYKFGQKDKLSSITSNIGSYNQQISRLRSSIEYDERSKSRIITQLENARLLYDKQAELFRSGLMSKADLERERVRLDDIERQYEKLEDDIIRKQNEINSLRQSINQVSIGRQESASATSVRLREGLNSLRAALDNWKQSYVLAAQIDGRVSLNSSIFSALQYVKKGDQVMAIVPPASDSIIGRMTLFVAGSGKVRKGQKVIIKLDSYPSHEFGAIVGEVESKSLVPKDSKYAVIVKLPNGLKTTFHKTIDFEQQLQGKAEIITENKRFLQRITEQVFAGR